MNIVPPSLISEVEWLLHSTRGLSKTGSGYFARIIKQLSTVLFVTVVLAMSVPSVRADEQVDLLLVLAADVSYSVNEQEFELQREGHAKAITNPRVINAIQSGAIGRTAICFIEWSGEIFQTVVTSWTLIRDAEDARRFAGKIIEAPRLFAENTSIGTAIRFATAQIERAPFRSERRVIDLSGDGVNNAGGSVASARDEAVAKGITINGLAILSDDLKEHTKEMKEHTNPPGGLEDYYRRNVIGGAKSFVVVTENFDAFGSALVRKLSTEIASASQVSYVMAR